VAVQVWLSLLQVRILLRLPLLLRLIFVLVARGTAGHFLFVFGSAMAR
jgi:hypothetical protein